MRACCWYEGLSLSDTAEVQFLNFLLLSDDISDNLFKPWFPVCDHEWFLMFESFLCLFSRMILWDGGRKLMEDESLWSSNPYQVLLWMAFQILKFLALQTFESNLSDLISGGGSV